MDAIRFNRSEEEIGALLEFLSDQNILQTNEKGEYEICDPNVESCEEDSSNFENEGKETPLKIKIKNSKKLPIRRKQKSPPREIKYSNSQA